jgi:hypothetical protein
MTWTTTEVTTRGRECWDRNRPPWRNLVVEYYYEDINPDYLGDISKGRRELWNNMAEDLRDNHLVCARQITHLFLGIWTSVHLVQCQLYGFIMIEIGGEQWS